MSLYGNIGSIIGTVGGFALGGPIGAAVGGTALGAIGSIAEKLKKPKYETITQRTYLNNNPYQGYLYGMPSLERNEKYLRQVKEPSQSYQRAEQATGILSMGASTAASFMNPEKFGGIKLGDLFKKDMQLPTIKQKQFQLKPEEEIPDIPFNTEQIARTIGRSPISRMSLLNANITSAYVPKSPLDTMLLQNPSYNYFNLY